MTEWLKPAILESPTLLLEPLKQRHQSGLVDSVQDGELWKLWYTSVPKPTEMSKFIQTASQECANGESIAFAVRLAETGQIVGSTRFMHIDAKNKRVEIGFTWYARTHQRSSVNTICKYLLLCHAFEDANAIAVEFRTNWMNRQSRNAIQRLGARQDGVLRNHVVSHDGVIRDTVVYSITMAEWPAVKRNLETLHLLERDNQNEMRLSATRNDQSSQ